MTIRAGKGDPLRPAWPAQATRRPAAWPFPAGSGGAAGAVALLLAAGSLSGSAAAARAESAAAARGDSTAKHTLADTTRVYDLPQIEVVGSYEDSLARRSASSQGVVTPKQLALRPLLRAGDVLESIPGVLISQHSGEGKANQYYLRGFNLDHGTDFATTVAGVPVNMPTHAHGQGYTDLNFLIPELVSGVEYRKGTYSAEEGDFSSAGSARISYRSTLPSPIVSLTLGGEGYRRVLLGGSPRLPSGGAIGSLELVRNDGPWVYPDNYRKVNGLLSYDTGEPDLGLSVTALGYDGHWNSTDQVPRRAVSSGAISRFGAIDPTDGGASYRYSLSADYRDIQPGSISRASAYLLAYKLDLFSNFTYFLNDTLNGDQIEQADRRVVTGFHLAHTDITGRRDHEMLQTVGVDVRDDEIAGVGLYHTKARRRLATIREDRVGEQSLSPYVQSDAQLLAFLRAIVGARADLYRFSVTSSYAPFSGSGVDGIVSPKASLILGPWGGLSLYVNGGYGFHSDDARGAHFDANSGSGAAQGVQAAPEHIPVPGGPQIATSPLLVRTKGAEVGARLAEGSRWSVAASVWGLDIASEHIFQGDDAVTAPSRPSRRTGIEFSSEAQPGERVRLDADLAYSRARFTDGDPVGDHIPGAVEGVISAGIEYQQPSGGFGELRLRYFGPRPLIEDNSVRSGASTVLNTNVGWHVHDGWTVALEVFNLLDRAVSDVDYYYTSRLPGEPLQGIADVHTHPQGPRSVRLALSTGVLR